MGCQPNLQLTLTVTILGAGGAAPPPAIDAGIRETALRACRAADDYCTGLRWELLAGIVSVGPATAPQAERPRIPTPA